MRVRLIVPALGAALAVGLLGTVPAGAESASPGASPGTTTPGATSPDATTPGAATPEQQAVTDAQAAVADLQGAVARAAASLSDGARKLEAGQAFLATTQAQAAQSRADADRAQQVAAQAKERLGEVVSAAFRTPTPGGLGLAIAGTPGQFSDSLHASADLELVRGNQQDLLHQAMAAGVTSRDLVVRADQLQADALRQDQQLALQVRALQQQAQDTKTRLEAAAQALQQAQRAKRLADEKAAREKAAADAAAAAAAATAGRAYQLAVIPDISGGGAGCSVSASATAGFANGFLPAEALCPLPGFPGQRLRADAATAFTAMAQTYPLCITDSYRDYAAQVDLFARKPSLAAVPGTSNHGLGIAVDFGCGADRFGSPPYLWLKANAARFGWVHPSWAEPGSGRPEPWHWEFRGVPAGGVVPPTTLDAPSSPSK